MRLYVVLRYVGITLLFNAGFLFLSGIVSLIYGDEGLFPLFYSALISFLFGIFPLIFIPRTENIRAKEGLLIVVYSWLLSCLVGALPYLLWGGEFTLTNAWFESVSGYTTTGSSILNNIEALPKGILFWRSATHFIGGIGIVIFVLAVLPSLGVFGNILYRSETSPWAIHEFRRSARNSIKILFRIYLGLTVAETLILMFCGMSLFDAITTSFATIATGGFSPRQASIAAYQSIPIEAVIILFMILSGIHFGLLFEAVRGKPSDLWRSPVVRFYLGVIAVATAAASWSTWQGGIYESLPEAFRYGLFQVASIGTSTGFASANSAVWPSLAQFMLLFLTLQCACAGSTSGGIKVDRILVFLKTALVKLKEIKHPRGVFSVKLAGEAIEEKAVTQSVVYIVFYLLIVFVSGVLLTALGVDGMSAFSGAAATAGNVGPGFGTVGSTANFAGIPEAGKWILTATMLLGRLEIYGLLLAIAPSFWKS